MSFINRRNLINRQNNQIIYFGKLDYQILRNRNIQKYLFNRNYIISLNNTKYEINEDERIMYGQHIEIVTNVQTDGNPDATKLQERNKKIKQYFKDMEKMSSNVYMNKNLNIKDVQKFDYKRFYE